MSPACLAGMPPGTSISDRKDEVNKGVVDRWFAGFWGKNYNPSIVDELSAPHIFFAHSLHLPRVGRMPLKTFMADLREAFPDFACERTANLIADGDEVVVRWVCEGTHTGPAFYDLVMGALPKASGRKMRFAGISVVRLIDGVITREAGLADGVSALDQLGFIRVPVWPA